MNSWLKRTAQLVLSFIVLAATSAAISEETKEWLQRMIQSSHTLSYEGTFVYIQGQDLDVMRIVHNQQNNVERQRMFSLNGMMREVVVDGEQVTCSLPSQQVSFSAANLNRSPLPISFPQDLDVLEQNYQFKILGDDRVADRKTRVVAVTPHDQMRFGYRLWLDYETGMLLRSALLDQSGNFLEQLIFTDFQPSDTIDLRLLQPRYASAILSEEEAAGESVTNSAWVIDDLPEGFNLIMHRRFSGLDSGQTTEHLVFSDGLATISVFMEKIVDQPLLEGASKMDATNAYGLMIGGYQAIVIGEVPLVAVQQVASSIRTAATGN